MTCKPCKPDPLKLLTLYTLDNKPDILEDGAFNWLVSQLPVGRPYGAIYTKWSNRYPDVPFFGTMIAWATVNGLGQRVETLRPIVDFDIQEVPWDDLVT
ncbi:hypothetical protein D3C79_450220 [compost metagenome]